MAKNKQSEDFFYDEYISVTETRDNIKDIVDRVKDDGAIYYLTRRGKPEAVLVSNEVWRDLNKRISDTYSKTFINPRFDSEVRYFTDEEIAQWEKDDRL